MSSQGMSVDNIRLENFLPPCPHASLGDYQIPSLVELKFLGQQNLSFLQKLWRNLARNYNNRIKTASHELNTFSPDDGESWSSQYVTKLLNACIRRLNLLTTKRAIIQEFEGRLHCAYKQTVCKPPFACWRSMSYFQNGDEVIHLESVDNEGDSATSGSFRIEHGFIESVLCDTEGRIDIAVVLDSGVRCWPSLMNPQFLTIKDAKFLAKHEKYCKLWLQSIGDLGNGLDLSSLQTELAQYLVRTKE